MCEGKQHQAKPSLKTRHNSSQIRARRKILYHHKQNVWQLNFFFIFFCKKLILVVTDINSKIHLFSSKKPKREQMLIRGKSQQGRPSFVSFISSLHLLSQHCDLCRTIYTRDLGCESHSHGFKHQTPTPTQKSVTVQLLGPHPRFNTADTLQIKPSHSLTCHQITLVLVATKAIQRPFA